MNRHAIVSALIVGVLTYFITAYLQHLSERGRLGQSKWIRHALVLVLVFVAALGVNALLG